MTDFHDVQFPARLAFGATGGPETRVDITRLASGYERRNTRWSAPVRRYDLSVGRRPMSEVRELLDFFEARSGPLHGFRFRDPFQHSTANTNSEIAAFDVELGTGDDVQSDFPLILANGRIISKPVVDTFVVAVGGNEISTGFELDKENGILVFTAPPALNASITVGFEFDVPVRFANEQLLLTQTSEQAGEISDISLLEIRV